MDYLTPVRVGGQRGSELGIVEQLATKDLLIANTSVSLYQQPTCGKVNQKPGRFIAR